MGVFFFDESIHSRGGFALGAFVYSASDPTSRLKSALVASGLVPAVDEFKSGAYVSKDPRQARARENLREVLHECGRVALVILPASDVTALGHEALVGLRTFLNANGLVRENHRVYLDAGLFKTKEEAQAIAHRLTLHTRVTLHPESDSRSVIGLQLADLVAHTASIMLLEQLGIVTKTVKAGPNSGYDPDLDIEIGFELWATLRYKFFCSDPPDPNTWKSQQDFHAKVEPYGLYISSFCSAELAKAARERFGYMYLGCIH